MYIKLLQADYCWQHGLFAANHRMVYLSKNLWLCKRAAIRAILKLAGELGIDCKVNVEYQEVE